MRRRRLLTNVLRSAIVVAILCTFSVSVAASDWGCLNVIPDFPKAFETSQAVFIGELIKIVEPSDSSPGAPLRKELQELTFKVEYSWKGAGFQEVGLPNLTVFSSPAMRTSCLSSISFEIGRKYLVYAGVTPGKELILFPRVIDTTLESESIVVPGTRTVLLENASDDLKKLRRLGIFRDAGAPRTF